MLYKEKGLRLTILVSYTSEMAINIGLDASIDGIAELERNKDNLTVQKSIMLYLKLLVQMLLEFIFLSCLPSIIQQYQDLKIRHCAICFDLPNADVQLTLHGHPGDIEILPLVSPYSQETFIERSLQ
jgi:hypothetical protein